jgi:E3 ubiquitin-protein ligase DOA10
LAVCESSVEEIQIMDFQIRAKIGHRQLRKADEMLRGLRQRMAVIAQAPTSEGARVQRALEQMKAPAALDLARQNGR